MLVVKLLEARSIQNHLVGIAHDKKNIRIIYKMSFGEHSYTTQ
jgi:hypothetical protein